MRRAVLALAAAAVFVASVVAAAFAYSGGSSTHVSVLLDWTPNPDHVGLFYARDEGMFAKRGLDVSIAAPSDPTSALKLVAAGKVDLAVSYEQELFFAAEKKLPVVAVAAVVPRPLNSIMAIEPGIRSVRDLKGKTIGVTGVPSDDASLDTALAHAGLSRADVKVQHVGYNLLPALLAHRVDAVLGVYRNVEGIELAQRGLKPAVIPLDRAGIPTYDELVLAASANRLRSDPDYAATVRKLVSGFLAGTAAARTHERTALAVLKKATASSDRFLTAATPATLALLAGPGGVGCMRAADWARFGAWMHRRALLKRGVAASAAMTTRFLPARCKG
ncbi:MAG TPA: ABC transporter substrate-binding protein [Gaiellaceae bacterium]|nr:ABC transporter substrate-binding protein [Gaiellaceae bacterium]